MPVDGVEKDYIKIDYAGGDCLYVPATQLDMVSKYIGGGEEGGVRDGEGLPAREGRSVKEAHHLPLLRQAVQGPAGEELLSV